MKLVQTRKCDGACCKESPRFPNEDKTDCIYRDTDPASMAEGCRIMRGEPTKLPLICPALERLSGVAAYEQTCLNWPQNTKPGKDTGACCWQWQDE